MGVEIPERMLFIGGTGTGKTSAAFSIIKTYLEETDSKFYYMALDRGAAQKLEQPLFKDPRIVAEDAWNWIGVRTVSYTHLTLPTTPYV